MRVGGGAPAVEVGAEGGGGRHELGHGLQVLQGELLRHLVRVGVGVGVRVAVAVRVAVRAGIRVRGRVKGAG